MDKIILQAYIVPGLPQLLLAPEKNPGWMKLKLAYDEVRLEIEKINPEIILYYSTQWLSVIGYLFQADPKPKWVHVDPNWHDYGSIPYEFVVDTEFAKLYAQVAKTVGFHTATVNYYGFPIDSGTIVAQKLLNPHNHIPAAMVSCNMYAEKAETILIGKAGAIALNQYGKKAVVVLVSSLSNRFHVEEVPPEQDHFSSLKDDEWNQKILELLSEGRLEDVDQCAREFGSEANGDLGFKGIWWLNGLCGQSNDFTGHLYEYQPVYGTGAALVRLTPTKPIRPPKFLSPQDLANEDHDIGDIVAPTPIDTITQNKDDEPELRVTANAQQVRPDQVKSISPIKDRENITTVISAEAPDPVGVYPHAKIVDDFIFLSGVGPRSKKGTGIPGVELDVDGNIVNYDIEKQTRSVINNVETILRSSGATLSNIVDIQVFLTNMKDDFKQFNQTYAEYFSEIRPTRTTIGITALPTPIAVEFKVIAKM